MLPVEITLTGLPSFTFNVHEANDEYVSPGIIRDKTWEPFETEIIRRCLDENTDFYDVGANIGWYSVVGGLSLRDGPATVHAFEPVLENAQLVLRNVVANGLSNVRINPCALGDSTRTVEMRLSSTNKGDHQAHEGVEEREVQPASMTRFDRYHVPSGRKTFIKMDTQGSELAIIEGMGNYLHSIDDLIMLIEFWPMGLEHQPGNVERLIGLLSQTRFRPFTVTEDDNHVRPADWSSISNAAVSSLAPSTGHFINLLLCKDDKFVHERFGDLFDGTSSHHLPDVPTLSA